MDGLGVLSSKDGRKYFGEFSRDKKDGFGIYFSKSPYKLYVGFWKNNKQDGVGKNIVKEEHKYGYWSNGERINWFTSEGEALSHFSDLQSNYIDLFHKTTNEIFSLLELQ